MHDGNRPNQNYNLSEDFFSGRRRHTRSNRDWSSDVCSSDLFGFWTRSHSPAGRSHSAGPLRAGPEPEVGRDAPDRGRPAGHAARGEGKVQDGPCHGGAADRDRKSVVEGTRREGGAGGTMKGK